MTFFYQLIFLYQSWIILALLFLILEVFDGSAIFFLPLSASGFVVSAYVFMLETYFFSWPLKLDMWYEILLGWAIFGILFSYLLTKFWKNSSDVNDDINQY